MIIKILFWTSFILITHTYILYPVLLLLLPKKKNQDGIMTEPASFPFISVLMAVHNEEAVIEKKIRRLFNTDYPHDKFEVIVGSDDSNDKSNEILEDLAAEFSSLTVIKYYKREGKPSTINNLVTQSKGEIILITDANVFPEEGTMRCLAGCFTDPETGLADSNLVSTGIRSDGVSLPEKTYTRIEAKIKHLEGRLWGTMMGPSGGFYAIRKDLFVPVQPNFLVDDFFICMNVLLKGKAAVSSLSAIVYENIITNIRDEFKRKVRISAGNFQNLNLFKKILLNPFNHISFAFISHKVLRWITPFLYLLLLITNALLMTGSLFYSRLFIIQFIFLLLPALDILLQRFNINLLILRFITHLYLMNLALLTGFFKYLRGIGSGIWDPTKRL